MEGCEKRVRHVSRVGYAKKVIGKRKCKSRRIKRVEVPKVSVTLQDLFFSCRHVFKGPGTVPLPNDVLKICRVLEKMKAEDVGLSSDLQFFKPNSIVPTKGTPPRVTYTTIYKCINFSLCLFFLPANGVIPLHNHPGMTVFSKLLLGKMHIKSYDWVDHHAAVISKDDSSQSSSQLRLAKLKTDSVFTAPCNASVLYPTTGGNIHAFTAITPCAVLDVLGPPYSAEDGRDCTYYKDYPRSSYSNGENKLEEGASYGWLEEIEMPEDSQMDWIEYLGPRIYGDEKYIESMCTAKL